ncbi:uncharacterized protein LOC142333117 [Lycorma delicatula]|uniref:uncharacterized protein LOC142333117 n=1 Tax=Lycorma delicatula TaxID=130591 RepID=UPI003F50D633
MEDNKDIEMNSVTFQHTNDIRYVCEFCEKELKTIQGLSAHRKSHSSSNKTIFQCGCCFKKFRDYYNLKRHVVTVHTKISVESQDVLNSEEIHEFKTMDEFKEWKENIEKETLSKYVIRRGAKQTKNGDITLKYFCHRDGFFHSKGKNIRRLKLMGSNKIGSHCPSCIFVKQKPDKVIIKYVKMHKGHDMDLQYLTSKNRIRALHKTKQHTSDMLSHAETLRQESVKIYDKKTEAKLKTFKGILDQEDNQDERDSVIECVAPIEIILDIGEVTSNVVCERKLESAFNEKNLPPDTLCSIKSELDENPTEEEVECITIIY